MRYLFVTTQLAQTKLDAAQQALIEKIQTSVDSLVDEIAKSRERIAAAETELVAARELSERELRQLREEFTQRLDELQAEIRSEQRTRLEEDSKTELKLVEDVKVVNESLDGYKVRPERLGLTVSDSKGGKRAADAQPLRRVGEGASEERGEGTQTDSRLFETTAAGAAS